MELDTDLKTLPLRVLLAAGFITYMSSAPEDMRHNALHDWMNNLGVQSFELRRFLSTESEQLIWKSEGLPSDDLSMENAMVILEVCAYMFNHIQPNSSPRKFLHPFPFSKKK